jgi:nitrogen fixation NifU-like protein
VSEAVNPSNVGTIDDADGYGVADGLCGDTMTMFVSLDEGKVARCTFTTDGCGPTIACGSCLTRLVSGMKVEDAAAVRPDDVAELLGGLPEDHEHCAALAVLALRNAIRDAGAKGRRGRT